MTGFARVDGRAGNKAWIWELKSVNGRGLELRFRLPPGFDSIEADLRGLAQSKLVRGNVNLNLQLVESAETAPSYRLNEALLEQLLAIAGKLEARGVGAPRLDGLLAVRGVVEPVGSVAEDEEARAALEAAMKQSFADALGKLVQSRNAEGAKLADVLGEQFTEIAALTKRAGEVEAVRPEGLRKRLQAQLGELLAQNPPVAEERLAQELALQITRLDVREELDRLKAHVSSAQALLKGDAKGVGRKLDFLMQEFNREANTLCSKAFDAGLTAIGLDLKLVIDRLREQAQNVE
jgi:uncharacterized protein (TIGR00255 family)